MATTSTYIYTSIIVITFVATSYLLWWTYKLEKPSTGKDCKTSGMKWDANCRYIQEIAPDPTLDSPKGLKPYLVKFTNSVGAGNSIFAGCWYRFRYVNTLTGGYSGFSDWSTLPVISGGCVAPCDPRVGCAFAQGSASCLFNQPTIGVNQKDTNYSPQKQEGKGFIYINLHRYINKDDPFSAIPPADNVPDQIIGTLLTPSKSGGESYWSLIDVLNNPCRTGCTPPDVCNGGSCPP